LCPRIGIDQYIIGQERYQRLPTLVSTEKAGFLASVKEENVIEDELEVGVGSLEIVNPLFVSHRWSFFAYLLDFVHNIIAHPFRVKGE
jgi:hypothetical protein